MKLFTAPWCGSVHAPLAEETSFLHYAPTHGFDNPAEVTITLKDPTGLMAQKYGVSYAAVGGAVADDGGAETDETAEANEDTADDMTLLPVAPLSGDAYYIGFASTFKGLSLNVSTAGVGTWVILWEYSTGVDSWSLLSDVTDDTTGFKVAGTNSVVWTVPSDWATDTVGAIANMYWVRGRYGHFAHTSSPKGQQAWIHEAYLGSGRVKLEDPTGTAIFEGRLMKAEATADSRTRTLTLYCQGWLSQLDEEQIIYDMREPLDGSGLRQSEIHTVITEDKEPVYTSGANYFMFDGDMDWDIDEWNGKYVILANEMAGNIIVDTGPWEETIAGGIDSDLPADGEENIWSGIESCHAMQDVADAFWEVVYYFRMYVTEGTLGAANPSACYLNVDFKFDSSGTGAYVEVYIYNFGTPDWVKVGSFNQSDEYALRNMRFAANWPSGSNFADNCIDANGKAQVKFKCVSGDPGVDTLDFDVYTLRFEAVIATTGYTSAISITDTLRGHADGGATYNTLKVGTDLSIANLGLWEGCQYAIAKPIYLHFESATGPILGGDTLMTLTCGAANVENTSGISTRQYVGKTRLQVAQDLARQDRAHFWIALGTTTVTYKSTFNDGAPETLTDTDVNSWLSTRDYSTLTNKATAYGIRIGNERLSSIHADATSEAIYGVIRTKITDDTGLVSEYDTLARATAIVNQYKDVQQILTCTIRGNTAKASHDKTLVLGDEVAITSTHLGLSAAVYIVQRWAYDSKSNLTTLLLHPRVSQVGLQRDERPSFEMVMQDFRRGTADRYIAAPETHEVA